MKQGISDRNESQKKLINTVIFKKKSLFTTIFTLRDIALEESNEYFKLYKTQV
jgi:hypothetical protein